MTGVKKRLSDMRSFIHIVILAAFFLLVFSCGGGGGGGDGSGSGSDGGGDNGSTTGDVVSGTVMSAVNMFADTDVNNPDADYISNNSFADAQELTVSDGKATVSGFVNVNYTGSRGDRFETNGDYQDFYKVYLTEGLTIALYMVEDSKTSELDMYLYDSNENKIDQVTTNSDGVASLTVPSDATYYIRLVAVEYGVIRTFTMYALMFGQVETTGTGNLRLSDDFVTDEVLVRFEDGDCDVVSPSGAESKAVSALGFVTKSGRSSRDKLLKPGSSADKDRLFETLGVKSAFDLSVGVGAMDTEAREKMETLWMIRGLRSQSGVRYAEPNYIRKAFTTTPNDSYYYNQWNLPLINLDEAWDHTTGSSSVIVAVVDTGVLLNHPDLKQNLVAGYDFVSSESISGDGDDGESGSSDIDDNPDDPGDHGNNDGTSSFHGTHVAGIIAAQINNSKGVAGVAGNVKIMPVRALGIGGGTTYDVMQAVKFAAGLDNDSDTKPESRADIINLSLGGGGYTSYEQEIYDEVREQGVIVVAAAGNDGNMTKSYPAAYDGVVAVSAVDYNKNFTTYSNYGSFIDVAAPGGSSSEKIWSTCGDDSSDTIDYEVYTTMYGTSMATPHVAGVAALMKSLYSSLTPDEFDGLLAGEYLTQDLGDSGWDKKFGYGMIDAEKAVDIALQSDENGSIPAFLTVSPASISFGTALTSSEVTVSRQGQGTLTVGTAYCSAVWLTVAASDVDSNNLGDYTVTVDRTDMADGSYSGTVTFPCASQSDVVVNVTMRVGHYSDTTDGGYHYVMLLDPNSMEVVEQFAAAGENGVYEFDISGDLENKTVLVFAGTDANNDGYICDPAEACGAYPSLDAPEEVTINGDMDGVDFSTDIHIDFPGLTVDSRMATSRFAAQGFPLKRKTRAQDNSESSTDSGIKRKVQ